MKLPQRESGQTPKGGMGLKNHASVTEEHTERGQGEVREVGRAIYVRLVSHTDRFAFYCKYNRKSLTYSFGRRVATVWSRAYINSNSGIRSPVRKLLCQSWREIMVA